MMKLHPDRHVNDADKVEKAAEATHVTRAYDVLNNPLSRALHLLELKGAAIDESDAVRLFDVYDTNSFSILHSHLLLEISLTSP